MSPSPSKTATPSPTATPSACPTVSPSVTQTATATKTTSPVMPNGFENPVYKMGDTIVFTKSYSISFAGDEAKVVTYDYMTGIYTFDLTKSNAKFSVPSATAASSVTTKP
jgi:hypothetical protein